MHCRQFNVTVQAYWTISISLSVSADIQVTAKLAAPNAPLGYSLCSLNLIFDGYTNAMQVSPALWSKPYDPPCMYLVQGSL